MANLYEYASSNDKTGYFLRGRSKTSGYYNLQTTLAANRLFEQLDYEPGRIPHTEGESVPGELTWRMYQVGLLETKNSDSTLNDLSNTELKETFEESNEQLSLSESDLETLQSFIASYSGPGQNRVTKLKPLLEPSNGNIPDTNSNGGFDFSVAIDTEQQSLRANAANTSLDEIETRIEQLERRDKVSCQVTADDIVSHPSGPQSFTQFWDGPARIQALYGTDLFDTLTYLLRYTTDTVEDLEFSIADHTIFDTPTGIDDELAGSFTTQAEAARTDCEYSIEFTNRYDPQHVPGDEEFTRYLGDEPLMTHTVQVENGHIQNWSVEVFEHDWSRTLRLFVFRKAGTYIDVISSFFDEFDAYHLDSPAHDFNELTIEFTVEEFDIEQETVRDLIESSKTK